ncbi:MAG TPA: hypothetical protein ENJ95_24185 [Bacteroidetes bacterium]|nr:hypothetical protein [Bacteroidota bacterium]
MKDEIINELESGMGKKYPYLNLYQQILSIFETGTTIKNFKKKLDVFFNIVDSLSTENKQFGLFHLLNYAINESNKGLYEFRTVILDIYKLGLEKEILLERGVISDGTFINIASVASGLGEYNWTLGFIKKYSPKLNSDMRGEAVTLSLAFLNFNKKDHGKATKLLLNYPFKEFNNNIIAKFLLVRSYFELFEEDASYYDLLNSYIVSFNKFIRRERNIPKNRKAWYLNSLSILSKFSKAILNSEIKDMKHKLLDEIEAKPTAIKGWLLEKINTI